jgi:hypothetical protein
MILSMALQEMSADELRELTRAQASPVETPRNRPGTSVTARAFLTRMLRAESQIASRYSGGVWNDATEREVLAAIAGR